MRQHEGRHAAVRSRCNARGRRTGRADKAGSLQHFEDRAMITVTFSTTGKWDYWPSSSMLVVTTSSGIRGLRAPRIARRSSPGRWWSGGLPMTKNLSNFLAAHLAELRELPRSRLPKACRRNRPRRLRIAQPPALLLDWQALQRLVARRTVNGLSAVPMPSSATAARHLRGQRQSFRARCVHGLDEPPPALRVQRSVSRNRARHCGYLGELRRPAQFVLLVVEVAVHAERAGAGDAKRRADAEKLMIVGVA